MPEETSEQEQEGASAKRKTIATTGLTGGGVTLLSMLTPLGPGWAFGAILASGALLALECHGTPEEYAWAVRQLAPLARRANNRMRKPTPHDERSEIAALTPEMEALQPKAASEKHAVLTTLPRRSPTFAEMRHLIVPGRDILGYDGEQFITADSLTQSVNMAAIGLPRSGKTTLLTFHVAQAVLRNAIVRGWDLHGDVVADLGDVFHILDDVEDILTDCAGLDREIKRRASLRKRALAGDRTAKQQWTQTRELFYIVDEFLALMTRLKTRKADREMVANMVLLLIAEGAKFKMRTILAGQTMPAALFGEGGSSARDIISTKYAFQSRDDQARRFGIESAAIENLLPLITGDDYKGYTILDGASLLKAKLVSIPWTTVEDIHELIAEQGYVAQDEDTEDEEDELFADLMRRHQNKPEPHEKPQAPRPMHKVYAVEGSPYARRQARAQRLREVPVSRQDEQRIPTLQEVRDAFPEQKPSKRDIQDRFELTDYRAYELYKQLNPKAVG